MVALDLLEFKFLISVVNALLNRQKIESFLLLCGNEATVLRVRNRGEKAYPKEEAGPFRDRLRICVRLLSV